ncbi:MAG: hypothetical protein H8E62_07480 [Planctomycetes bacterium]|nr:hypothetical protein [Planctomycetota bacterium]
MKEQKEKVTKGWRIFWVIFDIIFFGIYIFYFLIISDPKKTLSFYDGLYDKNYTFGILFVPFVLWPFTATLLMTLLVRLFFWNCYFENKTRLWFTRIAVMLLPVLFFILSFLFPVGQPGYKPFTAGFHQRMQKRLDVEKIRVWLETLDPELFDGESYDLIYRLNDNVFPFPIPKNVPPFPIPKEIRGLGENVRRLDFYTENKMRCIRIKWGSFLGSWGIVIGPEEMKIPASDFSDDGECRLKLEDGVYVWHELQ